MINQERLSDFPCLPGECPVREEENTQPWWTDILTAVICTYSSGGGTIGGSIRAGSIAAAQEGEGSG